MKILRSGLLPVVALCMLLITGLPNAAAGPARSSTPSRASDGQFFSGHGGDVRGPFSLLGGRYEIDVWALYNATYDADNAGTCVFTAYLNGLEQPLFVNLATAIPVLASVPYHYTPQLTVPAGHYKLIVSPLSDCDWNMTILRLGPAVPAIDIVSLDIYLHRGNTFTPTTVVHMGQTIDFAVFYRLAGAVSGTPAGQVAFTENGKPLASYRLYPWKDANGLKQLDVNLTVAKGSANTPGLVVATFTVTVGALHASQSIGFTLAT